MTKEVQIITLRDNAKEQLMQIKSIDEGMTYRNQVKAFADYARAEKMDTELQVILSEQKIRTERILGLILKEGKERGEYAKETDNQSSVVTQGNHRKKTLPELGLTKKQSANFQKLASIPDNTFEEFINEKKSNVDKAVNELTTTGAVRLAESIAEPKIKDDPEMEKFFRRANSIIDEINKMPVIYRMRIKQSIKT